MARNMKAQMMKVQTMKVQFMKANSKATFAKEEGKSEKRGTHESAAVFGPSQFHFAMHKDAPQRLGSEVRSRLGMKL